MGARKAASLARGRYQPSQSIPLWLVTLQSLSLLPIFSRHAQQRAPRVLVGRKRGAACSVQRLERSKLRKVLISVCHGRQLGDLGIVAAVRRGRLDGDAMPSGPYWRTSNRPT
jgi:hypothetical protein